jgi:glycosyltransferase involved in cell wall biosynthesis
VSDVLEGPRGSVVLLISNVGMGGAERQAVYLALGLRSRGWKVTIASMIPWLAPDFQVWLDKAGVPVEFLQHEVAARPGPLARATRALVRLIRRERPKVLIGFMPHGAILARVIGRLMRVPTVITSLRNQKSTHGWHDWVLALTRGLDDGSVTNSAAAVEAQLRARVTTPRKAKLIPNGFDLARVADAEPAVVDTDGAFLWLNVAVVRHEKDHRGLLAAAKILSETRRFRMIVAGEGPLLDDMRRLVVEMGLEGIVEFVGIRREVFELIHRADAFVLSSIWEGLPNVLIEAHAGGLPAVATNVGGCAEVVLDGVSGHLVPPSDPAQLAAAMQRIMDMPEAERRAMGAAGRDHVVSTFSMENMVTQWDRLIAG